MITLTLFESLTFENLEILHLWLCAILIVGDEL